MEDLKPNGTEISSAYSTRGDALALVSQDHHFIPCFYSKRWALSAGRLCEFSRPFKVIKPRRTSPKGTGYVPGGYALMDVAPDQVNRPEERFYKPIDTRAADALVLIEAGIANGDWLPKLRDA